ncbi:transcription factor bHLH68-like [Impatiens glandulifera]|uniref:transcription factor bHLH68-like n=1 Tax=Impatiens glandulifera TaxID=253017 RepID=UPI001FB187E2|nr:transcription factor bHLH68-like [Impatiens glandulifera]
MMEGNPNWWNLNNMMRSQASFSPCSSFFDQQHTTSDSDHTSSNSYVDGQEQFPQSWSQLLMGGMANEEEGGNHSISQLQGKNMETDNWEYHHDQTLNPLSNLRFLAVDAKESVAPSILDVHGGDDSYHRETLMLQTCISINNSSIVHVTNDPSMSQESFISNGSVDISNNTKKSVVVSRRQQITEHGSTSKCNSMVTGVVHKKPRVQSSSQPPLRVRKELGDRITALHQIVSPFGKTDTASVLLEAIGCIRFLQGQIQALSSPYLDNSGSTNIRHHHPFSHVQGEINYAFHFDQEEEDGGKDLRSRGLCLVPISSINNNNNNEIESNIKGGAAADFWVTQGLGGGF